MGNVLFGPTVQRRMGDGEALRRAHELLAATGLEEFQRSSRLPAIRRYAATRGDRARLINRPRVLLMDEPFGALDAQTRMAMQELLLSIWADLAPTIIFVTHDVEEALFLGDRVGVMSARPGRMKLEVQVPLGRPRTIDAITSPPFVELKARILQELRVETALRPAPL